VRARAEAARFGEIEDRIESLVRRGIQDEEQSRLDGSLIELENNWGAISVFIHGWVNNAYWGPLFLRGRQFDTLTQLMSAIRWVLIRNTYNAGGS